MQIPPALVVPFRNALQNQGIDPNTIDAYGNIHPEGIVSAFYNQVTVRTSVTPDLIFPISAGGAPPSAAERELLNQLQPTVVLSGPAGSFVLAPYGQAAGGQRSWWPVVLIGGGALAFVGWAVFGRR
jgi:hypothetical protein